MSKEDTDALAWRMMLENEEYSELNRIFAINGILSSGYFDELNEEEQDEVIKRLAIGIQTFNAHMKQAIEDQYDWRRLPPIEVSGNEES